MKIITTIGGNLFTIAATHFGDARQWINIAQADNLSDPFLSGQSQIIIPQASTAFSDGIGPQ